MPSVDVAMARSLQNGGAWEKLTAALARSIVRDLNKRDIITNAEGQISSVQEAFSSWGNCMAVVWCKWPVIALIIIGGLIIFSILWCIIRCACCGLSCCCGCFRCLKCCGDCCGCCDPPNGKRHKYLDEPYIPPHQGYRTEPPMQTSGPFGGGNRVSVPQYAEFDSPRKDGEDSLPVMPTWETAGSKKVQLEEEELEMDQLKKPASNDPRDSLAHGSTSGHTSPMPMDHLLQNEQMGGQGSSYFAGNGQPQNPFASSQQGYDYNAPTNRESVGFGLDQPYDTAAPIAAGAVAAAAIGHQGSTSPDHRYNTYGQNHGEQTYAELPGSPSDVGQNEYHNGYNQPPAGDHTAELQGAPYGAMPGGMYRQQSADRVPDAYGMRRSPPGEAMARQSPYGVDPRMRNSPGPRQAPMQRGASPYGQPPQRSTVSPMQSPYAPPPGPGPTRDYNRPYASPAERRYGSPSPRSQQQQQQQREPSPAAQYPPSPSHSPIVNNSGFDFNSGYSRPSTRDDHDSDPLSPPPPANQAYPGYKPYSPAGQI